MTAQVLMVLHRLLARLLLGARADELHQRVLARPRLLRDAGAEGEAWAGRKRKR